MNDNKRLTEGLLEKGAPFLTGEEVKKLGGSDELAAKAATLNKDTAKSVIAGADAGAVIALSERRDLGLEVAKELLTVGIKNLHPEDAIGCINRVFESVAEDEALLTYLIEEADDRQMAILLESEAVTGAFSWNYEAAGKALAKIKFEKLHGRGTAERFLDSMEPEVIADINAETLVKAVHAGGRPELLDSLLYIRPDWEDGWKAGLQLAKEEGGVWLRALTSAYGRTEDLFLTEETCDEIESLLLNPGEFDPAAWCKQTHTLRTASKETVESGHEDLCDVLSEWSDIWGCRIWQAWKALAENPELDDDWLFSAGLKAALFSESLNNWAAASIFRLEANPEALEKAIDTDGLIVGKFLKSVAWAMGEIYKQFEPTENTRRLWRDMQKLAGKEDFYRQEEWVLSHRLGKLWPEETSVIAILKSESRSPGAAWLVTKLAGTGSAGAAWAADAIAAGFEGTCAELIAAVTEVTAPKESKQRGVSF